MTSINDKLERVRKPRVHIKYNVETEGAEVEKELPFTVGVLGDYAGSHPGEVQKPLKERKFVQVDRDNIDAVMANIKPGVKFSVPDTLSDDSRELSIELQFNAMKDFEPEQLIQQIPALRQLKQARDRLRDLLTKADRSDQLEHILEGVLQDPSKMQQLVEELNAEKNKE